MSKLTLNIVEPGSPTPINPGSIDPSVPSTGLFTHGIGAPEATIIATVSLVVILAIIGAVIYHKKKAGKGSTISLLTKCKQVIKSKKHAPGLAVLALLVSIGTVAGLVKLTTSAIEGDELEAANVDNSSLTVDVSSTELTIELADDPVFAVLPVDITVAEATDLGYTLTAYTDSTNLVSTTDSSEVIPMVTVDTTDTEEANEAEELRSSESDAAESSDSSSLVPLSPNTYGLSFTNPESALDEVYTSLSTDSTTPTFITDKDYLATEAEDTTTIYYGFYITPDTPYGTYTGSNISVDAIPNIATVTYNANGLYFNDSEEATENTVGYKPNIAEAPIEEVTGEYLTPTPLTPVDPSTTVHYTFLGWSEDKDATTPTYTNEEDILANLTLTKNESLTLYAVWHYDTVLSFNGNTSDGGEAIEQQTIAAGTTITLPHNTYTRTGSVFTSWNTVAEPTEQDPGKSYADEAEFIAPDSSADITLYAQWAYYTTITFDGNGETSGSMADQTIVAGTPQNLTPNAYAKDGYIFNGWNTVQTPTTENPGTAYADKAQYTASTIAAENVTLYAQWMQPTMQNVSAWGSSLSQGDSIQVPDTRDGKSYWVAKLADGNIWMTQNLDFDITNKGADLNSTNTDVPQDWEDAGKLTNTYSTGTTTWNGSNTTPESYNPGDLYWDGNVTTSGGNLSNRTTTEPSSTYGTHYHVGNYYNWTAAVAMNDSSSYTTNYTDVNQSICPAGWRLPTYSGDKSYQNLVGTQSLTAGTSGNIQSAPTYFVYGGNWNGSSSYVGYVGYYWSSVVNSSGYAYRLYFGASGSLSPQNGYDRFRGYSIRCVAR